MRYGCHRQYHDATAIHVKFNIHIVGVILSNIMNSEQTAIVKIAQADATKLLRPLAVA